MLDRRNEKTMFELILTVAQNDDRIRFVILNGSRTSPAAKKDNFQDYDIVFGVTDIEALVQDTQWLKQFGELLIMQKPDEIDGIWPASKDRFAFLMQFTDSNRIDLTLLPHKNKLSPDSQSVLLLDKDNALKKFAPPSDNDYLPQTPTQTLFDNCCNEFFWTALGVAKGIARKELTLAKHLSEQITKAELIKLLTWYAGIKTDFKKSIGKFGKYLQDYLDDELWQSLVKTYSDADYTNMWDSLFAMCVLFNKVALRISAKFKFVYDEGDYTNVTAYLEETRSAKKINAN